jgi:hypothetical protein
MNDVDLSLVLGADRNKASRQASQTPGLHSTAKEQADQAPMVKSYAEVKRADHGPVWRNLSRLDTGLTRYPCE